MAFHVDRARPPCPERSAALQALAGNHLLDAGQAAPDDAAALQRDAGDQFLVQRGAGQQTARRRPCTSVATTTSPDFSDGSSPPATPKLMTPRNVEGSSVASSARSCCGSLLLQMTIMPGPAAMRASWHQDLSQSTPAVDRS